VKERSYKETIKKKKTSLVLGGGDFFIKE